MSTSTVALKAKGYAKSTQVFYKKYAKFLILAVAAVLSAVFGLVHTGMLPGEWVNVAIIGVGSLSVLAAPNIPGAKYTKEIIAGLTAALTIISALLSGIDATSLMQILFVAFGAAGVGGVKNVGDVLDVIKKAVPVPAINKK